MDSEYFVFPPSNKSSKFTTCRQTIQIVQGELVGIQRQPDIIFKTVVDQRTWNEHETTIFQVYSINIYILYIQDLPSYPSTFYLLIYISKFSNETISSKSDNFFSSCVSWTRFSKQYFWAPCSWYVFRIWMRIVFALHSSIGSTIVLLYSKKIASKTTKKHKTYILFQHNPLEHSLWITYSVWKSVLEISRDSDSEDRPMSCSFDIFDCHILSCCLIEPIILSDIFHHLRLNTKDSV